MLKNSALSFAFIGLVILSCDYIKRSGEFVFNRYRVSSSAMSPTLKIGDTYAAFSTDVYSTNQIVVYHPPIKYSFDEKVVYTFRLVGTPGDILEMRNGRLFLNGKIYPFTIDLKHSYEVKTSMPLNSKKLEGFEYHMIDADLYLFHSTPEEIKMLKENRAVKKIVPKIKSPEEEHNKYYEAPICIIGRNGDNWGPILVPKKGDEILLTDDNWNQYETILKEYENKPNLIPGDKLTTDKDYYFVLGDNRHNALDSRYSGFIPHDKMRGILDVQ